jgi:hypothetical protein
VRPTAKPKNAIYEQAVIASMPTSIAGFAGKQVGNPLPLHIGKFVPLGHRRDSRSSNLDSHESHIPVRRNPKCRLDLTHLRAGWTIFLASSGSKESELDARNSVPLA